MNPRLSGALARALSDIAAAQPGERNNAVFKAAAFVGSFVNFDGFGSVQRELLQAALAIGLPHTEAKAAVNSGLNRGKDRPIVDERAPDPDPIAYESWADLCRRKHLDPATTAERWDIKHPVYHAGEPSVTYPVENIAVHRVRLMSRPKGLTKWLRTAGPIDTLYGVRHWRGTGPILLVNGESGVWAADAAGLDACCTCVGEASALKANAIATLSAATREVWIVYDCDATGRKGALKVLTQLREANIAARALQLPADLGKGGDLGDLYVRHGADLLTVLQSLPDLDPPAPADATPGPLFDEPDAADHAEELASATPPPERQRIADAIPSAPVPRNLRIPAGYRLSGSEIWHCPADGKHEVAARTPIFVTDRFEDQDAEHYLELSYRLPRDAGWRTHVAKRGDLANTRNIVGLASLGLPVTSPTASALVQYIAAAEDAAAEACIPIRRTTTVIGWQPGGTFLRGANQHGRGCPERRPYGGDVDVVIDAIHERGELSEWIRVVWPIIQTRPMVAAAIAVAAAAPLLHLLECESFVVDLCGLTSGGKTTTARLAASVWGAPELRRSWETTRVGIERLAGAIHDVLLILDDTTRAAKPGTCASVVYDLIDGSGRMRGTTTGSAKSATFRSPLLSTGEDALSSATQQGGLRARTLTLRGSPLGDRSEANAILAEHLDDTARHHYGHCGAALITYLQALTPDARAELRQRYQAECERYRSAARRHESAVSSRQARAAACLSVAGRCLESALGMDTAVDWLPLSLWDQIVTTGASADRSAAAMELILAWVASKANAIASVGATASNTPTTGWIGVRTGAGLHLVPGLVDEQLQRAGFAPGEVVSAWVDRGWLRKDGANRTVKATLAGNRVRLYGLTRDIADQDGEEKDNGVVF